MMIAFFTVKRITSSFNQLNSYGFILDYYSGVTSKEGTAKGGETFTIPANITGATYRDTVTLHYWYDTNASDIRNFTYTYGIIAPLNNNTIANMGNQDYGLGTFERIFLIVLLDIIIVGIAAMIGRPIPGMALAFFINSFFANTFKSNSELLLCFIKITS